MISINGGKKRKDLFEKRNPNTIVLVATLDLNLIIQILVLIF